ncbi:hypothetical protein MXD61_21015 [Frankia sp. AgPm24]|uniref:hypothetical protein n=1 Tax=Frankia sp. AgPm24 TaxID=631128 RepID=UPI00200F51D1|nr:hypothetical protein [Frankia sp. AgPm24]MCK9924317.1 hypothetical protein [Frankia sp. AgPm24]
MDDTASAADLRWFLGFMVVRMASELLAAVVISRRRGARPARVFAVCSESVLVIAFGLWTLIAWGVWFVLAYLVAEVVLSAVAVVRWFRDRQRAGMAFHHDARED